MRVNVSFSSDVEEVPKAVSFLLGEASRKLNEISTDLNTLRFEVEKTRKEEKESLEHYFSEISYLRERLFDIDNGLVDGASILEGFYNLEEKIAQQLEEAQQEEEQQEGEDDDKAD